MHFTVEQDFEPKHHEYLSFFFQTVKRYKRSATLALYFFNQWLDECVFGIKDTMRLVLGNVSDFYFSVMSIQ